MVLQPDEALRLDVLQQPMQHISKTAFFGHRSHSSHTCVQVCTAWSYLATSMHPCEPLVTSLQITDWLHSSHMIIEMYTAHITSL